MGQALFPSGPWVGFYTYQRSPQRFLMDLHLHFQRGKIDGEGADGLDHFTITGIYDEKSGECSWQKIYPTRPPVAYSGYREGKGIWGLRTLSTTKGGFRIWPLSEGGPPDLRKLEEEESGELVTAAPLVVTTPMPRAEK